MNIFLVVQNEYKKSLKYKKKLIISLLIPIIAVVSAIGINQVLKPTINIGILNENHSTIGNDFKEKASEIDGIKVTEAEMKSKNTDMIIGKYTFVITFEGNNNYIVDALDENRKYQVAGVIENFIESGDLQSLKILLDKSTEESITSTERGIGFILLALLISCTMGACSIIKDKDEGILKRILLTPKSPKIYILGGALYNLIFSEVQILTASLFIWILGLNLDISIWNFILIGSLISLTTISIATLICNLFKTELEASAVIASLGVITSIIGGAFLPLAKMPKAINFISNFTITKWVMKVLSNFQVENVNLNVLMPLGIICLLSGLCLVGAVIVGEKKFS